MQKRDILILAFVVAAVLFPLAYYFLMGYR